MVGKFCLHHNWWFCESIVFFGEKKVFQVLIPFIINIKCDSSSFCGGAKVKNLACAALIAVATVPQFNYTCIKKHAKSVKEHGSVLLFPETSEEVQMFGVS